ncbi:HAD family hydrolase [Candidatus Magnetomonas plexicatena]|uniref:HAD family hydrolase n=1 Tax=Candidatus Magnetomonas plexicatena TaxID=2552947 RepID=UPI001C794BC4|nr:HAD family hydrolase [Nitrospirales bacterium LBB_01]
MDFYKAAIFDIDDTLYPEMMFVRSGFRVVAEYLGREFSEDSDFIFSRMLEILKSDGRGKVFDNILYEIGKLSCENVLTLLYLYRNHKPDIQLYDDVVPVIKKLRNSGVKTAVITDGMTSVQQNKVNALKIQPLFDVIIYTDSLGANYWKPSHVPFQIALNILGLSSSSGCVYVGDNPTKDFIGAEACGIQGIQIVRDDENLINPEIAPVKSNGHRVIIRSLTEYFR